MANKLFSACVGMTIGIELFSLMSTSNVFLAIANGVIIGVVFVVWVRSVRISHV